MSIEWLLTKTTDTDGRKKPVKKIPKEGGYSNEGAVSKRDEQNDGEINSQNERQLKNGCLLSPEIKHRQIELNFRCECGFEGTVNQDNMDKKLPEKHKKGFVTFECPNCKRQIQYDHSTGTYRTPKGILGVLFGKFS